MPDIDAFFYVDTMGLPLSEVMRRCSEKNRPINLSAFSRSAKEHGWTLQKTESVIEEAIAELRSEHVFALLEGEK